MISVLLILAVIGLYGLLHSWLASLRIKQRASKLIGDSLATRYYRPAYNVFAVLSLLPVLALAAALPDQLLYTIRPPWLILTSILQVAALLALGVGLLQTGVLEFFGLRQIFNPQTNRAGEFVTGGFYRWVRHPLYSAGLVIIWLSPIMSSNLLALYIGINLYLVIGAVVEERKLIREFGKAYRLYQRNTPMFVPRLPKKLFKV